MTRALTGLKGWLILGAAILFSVPGHTADRYGNWFVQRSGGFVEAYTSNDSQSTLGILCKSDECIFYIDNNTQCQDGSEYPGLMNAPSGATHVTLRCAEIGSRDRNRHVYLISTFEAVESAVGDESVIGIVVPMEDESFKVARFNASGFAQAAAAVRSLISPERNSLRDRRL